MSNPERLHSLDAVCGGALLVGKALNGRKRVRESRAGGVAGDSASGTAARASADAASLS
jgi:hypothetical protein